MKPEVAGFFNFPTNTISYVVIDPKTKACAVIDSVLDFSLRSGRTSSTFTDGIIEYIQSNKLKVEWILETHVHADHISAAPYIKQKLGGKLAIGAKIIEVQSTFGKVFNAGSDFQLDGSQFDVLFEQGDTFMIGSIPAAVIYTPGHTPACITYVIDDCAFVGDTLFMPDYGTARADFPGGDARHLYQSIQKLFTLPDETKLYLCHDYKPKNRDQFCWQTTIAKQKQLNIHVHAGVTEEEFVNMRHERDKSLDLPELIIPSIQVNMRGGNLPSPEENGQRYLKIPIDVF
ncbi:MAG TPA: MBL fold metallo-hydrolase [Gammaproteobacteria bacterium]|nr:MBL fold metallo-hydrolase [Gammaproteobacteria bacterium]